MVDFTSFKKADLIDACSKVGVNTNTKDTKKSLIDKIEKYIEDNGDEGLAAIEDILDVEEVEEDDEEEAAEEVTLTEEGEIKDDEDEEFKGPPVDLKAMIVDPILDFTEPYYAQLLDYYDELSLKVNEFNEDIRNSLSTVVSLNYLLLIFEVAIFSYNYIPLKDLKSNYSIHPLIKSNLPDYILNSCIVLPDLTYALNFKVLSVFINWVIYSIALPLAGSFYLNFTRRTVTFYDDDDEEDFEIPVRIYEYDPFVFNILKVLIFYLISLPSSKLFFTSSFGGFFKIFADQLLIQFGFYKEFTVVLGNLPIIFGLANLVIGIYSQFEEY